MLKQKNILFAILGFAVIGSILLVAVRATQSGAVKVDLNTATVSDNACFRDEALYFEPCEDTTPAPTPEPEPEPEPTPEPSTLSILVFSETDDYKTGGKPLANARPDFIDEGIKAGQAYIKNTFSDGGNTVDVTDDSTGFFTDAKLATYDAVVFLSPSGDSLNNSEQAAFERFIQAGNGFVGIHYAGLNEGNRGNTNANALPWPWYSNLVGRTWDGLVAAQTFNASRIDDFIIEADYVTTSVTNPITTDIPATFTHTDELYRFYTEPNNSGVIDLVTLDPSSIPNGNNSYPNKLADPHHVSWYQPNYDGGRSFYTAMGDNPESYKQKNFTSMLVNAIGWAAGR